VSVQFTWRALDEAGEARTAATRPAFLPQTLAFSGQTFFWPRNLPQERYNSMEPVPKKEIPAEKGDAHLWWTSVPCQRSLSTSCPHFHYSHLNQRRQSAAHSPLPGST
jgi:hypothetical protein